MSSVVISGNTSGTITLSAPDVSGTNTATLPAATGTVMVSGNMPAFSAYASSTQTGLTNGTFTKIVLNTKVFDTNNNFDSTTNYRFTPTVAGYYQINGTVSGNATTTNGIGGVIYKNGSVYLWSTASPTALNQAANLSSLIYLNGSTDYIELYLYNGSGGTISTVSGSTNIQLSGCLMRAA
jgi:hypothetical protein